MSSKGSSTDGRTDLANGSLSSSPEEMSGAEEGRETSSGIEVEASDLSLSLTGDDGGPNRTSTESRGTDTESSGEDKDSDSMEDTGHYSVNDESQVHDRSEEEEEHPRRRVQRKRAIVTRTHQTMSGPWKTGCPQRHQPCPDLAGKPFLPFGSGSWAQVPALCMRLVGQESLCSVSACSMGLKAILAVSILCTLTNAAPGWPVAAMT